jgi:hypothetical protein
MHRYNPAGLIANAVPIAAIDARVLEAAHVGGAGLTS